MDSVQACSMSVPETGRKSTNQGQAHSAGMASFELLFSLMPEPMWIFEFNTLKFLAVNDAAVERYGYARDEFLIMTVADILQDVQLPQLLKCLSAADVDRFRMWRHLDRNGEVFSVNVRQKVFELDGRKTVLAMARETAVLDDVLRHLDIQAAYYQELFAASRDGIVLLDETGVILDANPAFQEMFDFELQDLQGLAPLAVIETGNASPDAISAFTPNSEYHGPDHRVGARKRKDGESIQVEVQVCPVAVGGSECVFAIYKDVS